MLGSPRTGVFALFLALALLSGAFLQPVSAQEPRDPLIDPPSGGAGSRFQIVGQTGWTPGETVTLLVTFTTSADPFGAPEASESGARASFTVTVLADGTWSFPIVVDDFFAPFGGPPDEPGYIVIRAIGESHQNANAYIYTVRSVLPAGSEAIAPAGAGPGAPRAAVIVLAAMFAAGVGGLLVVSGALRGRFADAA